MTWHGDINARLRLPCQLSLSMIFISSRTSIHKSNPPYSRFNSVIEQWLEHRLLDIGVVSSNPVLYMFLIHVINFFFNFLVFSYYLSQFWRKTMCDIIRDWILLVCFSWRYEATEGPRVNFIMREALFELYTWILCRFIPPWQTNK